MSKEKKYTLSTCTERSRSEAEGIIPELRFPEFIDIGEWEVKKLGEIGDPLMCKRILKEQTTSNPENGIPFYKIGTFGHKADSYISINIYNDFKSKYSFPNKGDILISASGTIGRLVVYNGYPAYFQDSNIVWLGNDEELIINKLLFYCYSTVAWQTSDGGIIKRLYNSDLRNIQIRYPKKKKEQQKIASFLSSSDDLIDAHKQKLETLKDHKKGLMQNLFPHPSTSSGGEKVPKYRFPEFENDGEWVEKELREISDLITKGTTPKKFYTKGVRYIKIEAFEENYINSEKCVFIDNEIHITDLKRSILKEGDILFAIAGATIGKVNIITEILLPANTNQALAIIRLKEKENKAFILNILKSYTMQVYIRKSISVGAQPNLNLEQMGSFSFFYAPTFKEQQKIASCLSALDELINEQTNKIEQLKTHKKGLMQGLFPSKGNGA